MIVVLSDEQLERIEDALSSARHYLPEDEVEAQRVELEIQDALGVVQAARTLLAA